LKVTLLGAGPFNDFFFVFFSKPLLLNFFFLRISYSLQSTARIQLATTMAFACKGSARATAGGRAATAAKLTRPPWLAYLTALTTASSTFSPPSASATLAGPGTIALPVSFVLQLHALHEAGDLVTLLNGITYGSLLGRGRLTCSQAL
jgi:hypothetical protein